MLHLERSIMIRLGSSPSRRRSVYPCFVHLKVCRGGHQGGGVVLLGRVVVGRVEDIVEHVLLHLPNLGVTIEPALQ